MNLNANYVILEDDSLLKIRFFMIRKSVILPDINIFLGIHHYSLNFTGKELSGDQPLIDFVYINKYLVPTKKPRELLIVKN